MLTKRSYQGDEFPRYGTCLSRLANLNVRAGSTTDSRDPPLPRPKLGDKQTKSARKQTLPLEGRLSGISGRTPPWERPALWSDYCLGLVGWLGLRWALTFGPGFRPRPIFFASLLRVAA